MARPKSPQREEAKRIYLEKRGRITVEQLASMIGTTNKKISAWKYRDTWDEELEKLPKKRGAKPGNRSGAKQKPTLNGNKNAVTHGAYAHPGYQDITPEQAEEIRRSEGSIMQKLNSELQDLLVRKAYLENQLKKYTETEPDAYYVDRIVHMVVPKTLEDIEKEETSDVKPGEIKDTETPDSTEHLRTSMKTFIKASSFERAMKIETELGRLHGRILKVLDSMKAYEMDQRRTELEKDRNDIARQKLTGEIEIDDGEDIIVSDLSDDE